MLHTEGVMKAILGLPYIFTPILGEMIQFDEHIFQRGWNHQLSKCSGSSNFEREIEKRYWKVKWWHSWTNHLKRKVTSVFCKVFLKPYIHGTLTNGYTENDGFENVISFQLSQFCVSSSFPFSIFWRMGSSSFLLPLLKPPWWFFVWVFPASLVGSLPVVWFFEAFIGSCETLGASIGANKAMSEWKLVP